MDVPVPPTPITVAGDSELVYELHLTNFAPTGLVLERLEVTDEDAGSVLADLGATELERRLYRPGAASAATGTGADARLIDAGSLGVVYLDRLPRRRGLMTFSLQRALCTTAEGFLE